MAAAGRIIVFTGEGKGKTTAAFGTVFRAAGHGQNVAVVQFIKGDGLYGELLAAERFPNIATTRIGGGFTWEASDPEEPRALARLAWNACVELAHAPDLDLLVMDELSYALAEGYVGVDEVLRLLREKEPAMSVVITGRGAPAELLEIADTVTEMRSLKHPFAQGLPARKGIEY